MALKADLNSLLREYAPDQCFINEMKRLNYYWSKINKDKKWIPGSTYPVQFETGQHSTFVMGGLPAVADINGATYAKANIASPATIIGSMKIHEKDLEKHSGDMKKSFLDFWPEKSKQFMKRFEERMSVLLLGDGSICTATANGTIGGVLKLDRPHLLTIGEKVEIDDDNSTPVAAFVRKINLNTKEVTFYDAPTGGAVVDLSGYATANKAKVYITGTSSSGESFNNLKSFILPSTLGGSDTIHGLNKIDNGPILQALYVDGSGWNTAKKLVEGLYDFYYQYDFLGRSEENEITVSYDKYQWISLYLQQAKQYMAKDQTAGVGYKGLTLVGPNGDMKIKALRDMTSDLAPVIDFSAVEFAGQTLFKMKHKQNGDLFHTERVAGAGGGYVHIVDIEVEGQHVCKAPGKLAAVHSLPTIASLT